jgi:hypothetical protein
MLQVVFSNDAFIPKQRSIKARVKLRTKYRQANVHALVDSGATNNFITPHIVNHFKIPRETLKIPKIIRNVDGSRNSIGKVTECVTLKVTYEQEEELQTFFIIDLGGDDMILGYPFLVAANPQINWKEGEFPGKVTAESDDAHLWKHNIPPPFDSNSKLELGDPNFIPNNERGVIHYPISCLRRTTVATKIAVEAADKKTRTWQEQVPPQYHKYGKVFSEEEAQRFPESKPWDHAIDLVPDAPATLDCKIYLLALREQEALDKFLEEHLSKGYI